MSGHRSYSAVSALRQCGERYRLERLEKLPSRPSCPAVAGRVVHSATEVIDEAIHFGVEKTRSQILESALMVANTRLNEEVAEHLVDFPDITSWKSYGRATKAKPHGEDIDWFREFGIPACINNYLDWRLEHPELVLYILPNGNPAIEVEFYVTLGPGDPVRGYIDRVFVNENNGGKLIVDIKSGQKPKTSEQLGIYKKALEAGSGEEFRWGTYIYGLKTGINVVPDIDLSMWTDEALGRIYGADTTVLLEKQLFLPNPGENCFHCGVSHHCAFAAASI